MTQKTSISPKDLLGFIETILLDRRGDWLSPEELWSHLSVAHPQIAERVQQKVLSYKDPERNNAVWFVSNTLSHLKDPGFEISDTERVPDMKGKAFWLVARAI